MFLKLKNNLEILFFRSAKVLLNVVFRRQGDVLPAHILKKMDKNIFDEFARDVSSYDIPRIIITGTNGKTTTANLIGSAFRISGKKICFNANGANMPNGVFGAVIGCYSLNGKFIPELVLLESDEKVFPYIAAKIKPDTIVVTNFFRDQLDRYGEVNITVHNIKRVIKDILPAAFLILPADEPLASFIGYGLKNPRLYYGFKKDIKKGNDNDNDNDGSLRRSDMLNDAVSCPNCGNILTCEENYAGVSLKYSCKVCGYKNSAPDILAFHCGDEKICFDLKDLPRTFSFKRALSGEYNISNYMAAFCVLKHYGLSNETVIFAFENYITKFGRSYKKVINGIKINIDLVKNPAGFNGVLGKIAFKENPVNVLLAFSDRDADGRDVSWIWDTNFEKFVKKFNRVVITGLRPYDMALRLKTAGINSDNITVVYGIKKALRKIIELASKDNAEVFILPTYTELLRLKKYIR